MTKKNPVYLTVILLALAVVTTFQTTFLLCRGYKGTDSSPSSSDLSEESGETVLDAATLDKLAELAKLYAADYPGKVDPEAMENYLVAAFIAGAGDAFGNYIPADSIEEYLASIEGNYEGIGVVVQYEEAGALLVTQVYSESPAERTGILVGDRITHIGEGEEKESVLDLGYSGAVTRVRGEEGTYVTLTLEREGEPEPIVLQVPREPLSEQTVMWHMYEGDARIAVIRITQFEVATVAQFKDALKNSAESGAEAYIFDVRSNPGGSLAAITQILDMLLPEGPIIRIQYKDRTKDTSISSDAACITAPMAVLCDGNTASAGELFCSALKDYKIATLFGSRTYGKGTMQTLQYLSDGSGISMTVAYYLPPFSENYHGIGVKPDVSCVLDDEAKKIGLSQLTDETDNQLRQAAEALVLSLANNG